MYFWPELAIETIPLIFDVENVTIIRKHYEIVNAEKLLIYTYAFLYQRQIKSMSEFYCEGEL